MSYKDPTCSLYYTSSLPADCKESGPQTTISGYTQRQNLTNIYNTVKEHKALHFYLPTQQLENGSEESNPGLIQLLDLLHRFFFFPKGISML